MPYQDKWLRGKVIERGTRECAKRYEVIRSFCAGAFGGSFTVCDIGANWCYFDFRLAQDFPGCSVVAFEFRVTKALRELVKQNKANRLVLMNHKVQLPELTALAELCKIDLVLALSVAHHLSEPIDDWIDGLLKLGRYVIVELAGEDSNRATAKGTILPERHKGRLIGCGDSHLKDGHQRPIVVFERAA